MNGCVGIAPVVRSFYGVSEFVCSGGRDEMDETVSCFLFSGGILFAEPIVNLLSARQRYPWNGFVDIECEVSGIATNTVYSWQLSAKNAANQTTLTSSTVTHGYSTLDTSTPITNRVNHLVWSTGADLGVVTNLAVELTLSLYQPGEAVQPWDGGPYWATKNVGSSTPEEDGLYFWWGDTVGYRWEGRWVASDGSSSNFSFDENNTVTLGQPNSALQAIGWLDSNGNLSP